MNRTDGIRTVWHQFCILQERHRIFHQRRCIWYSDSRSSVQRLPWRSSNRRRGCHVRAHITENDCCVCGTAFVNYGQLWMDAISFGGAVGVSFGASYQIAMRPNNILRECQKGFVRIFQWHCHVHESCVAGCDGICTFFLRENCLISDVCHFDTRSRGYVYCFVNLWYRRYCSRRYIYFSCCHCYRYCYCYISHRTARCSIVTAFLGSSKQSVSTICTTSGKRTDSGTDSSPDLLTTALPAWSEAAPATKTTKTSAALYKYIEFIH